MSSPFSTQMRDQFTAVLDHPSRLAVPREVRDALLKLSLLTRHSEIDGPFLLGAALKEVAEPNLHDLALDKLFRARARVKQQIELGLSALMGRDGADPFIVWNRDAGSAVTIEDALTVVCDTVIHAREAESATKQERDGLERRLHEALVREAELQSQAEVRRTQNIRELQLMLQHAGGGRCDGPKVAEIAAEALAELGAEALWVVPDNDQGECFNEERSDGVTAANVVRPCVRAIGGGPVIRKGVVMLPNA